MNQSPEHIMVGMSGGVDSSTSAVLLKQQGRSVAGMFMKNWEEDDRDGQCSAEQDADDARKVADHLGIPFYARNFAAEYWDNVFEYFLAEYRAGRTPNPDVMCNREIKFKTFLEHADDLGASHIATGHYARVGRDNSRLQLLRGLDRNKDQSYFLYTLGQQQLARTLFPLGEYEKPAVRELAQQAGLENFAKKDSTGICFIGERNFKDFLSRYLPATPGVMQTPAGEHLGQHDGLMYYTLGQRQGLGIGGRRDRGEDPWYVIGKNLDNNILYVDQGHDHPLLFSDRLDASQLSWVAGEAPGTDQPFSAKVRYRQSDQACRIEILEDDRCQIFFEQPQRAVTPGQSLVLYDNEVCLGGGIIDWTNTPVI